MKVKVLFFITLIFSNTILFSQDLSKLYIEKRLKWNDHIKLNQVNELAKFDFSKIWTTSPSHFIVGYIGPNYQRIRIKVLNVTKSDSAPTIYKITGKTKTLNNICEFKGILRLDQIYEFKKGAFDLPENYSKAGFIIGEYILRENSTKYGSGIFNGTFISTWFLDKNGNEVLYDTSYKFGSPVKINNHFLGCWQSYKTKALKTCNWGEHFIAIPKDLCENCGLSFMPNEKYASVGWESFLTIWSVSDSLKINKTVQRKIS